jgi:hypothetical protein
MPKKSNIFVICDKEHKCSGSHFNEQGKNLSTI